MAGVEKLYKFRPLGDAELWPDGPSSTQEVVRILTERSLYAATPAQLNDDFDFRLGSAASDEPATNEDMFAFCLELTGGIDFSDPEIIAQALEQVAEREDYQAGLRLSRMIALSRSSRAAYMDNQSSPVAAQEGMIRVLEEDIRTTYRVISLTARNNDPKMWSHYAGGNAGVCLGFRIREGATLAEAMKVRYGEFPRFVLGRTPLGEVRQGVVLTKSTDWAYEEEWRWVVCNLNDPSALPRFGKFERECLAEIIFGLRVDRKAEEEVRKAAGGFPEVTFGRVSRLPASYELEVSWD